MDFNNKLSKILGNNKKIDEVQVDERVIDEITKIAINADPKEFIALLSGKTEDNILKITGLIFLPFEASESSAVMQMFMMPITTNAVGSVHSHPGPSAQPSNADLTFFSKNGYFHMIICRPYSQYSIKAYDTFGSPLTFTIKDLGDDVEIKRFDKDEIDKELFDEEFIKELKELEKEEFELEEKNIEENNTTKEPIIPEIVQDTPYTKKTNPAIHQFTPRYRDKPKTTDKPIKRMNNNPLQNMGIPKTINLQLEHEGKLIEKELPLPPEYELGDELVVDIRTDKTPGDSIDEINLTVKKPTNVITSTLSGNNLNLKNNNNVKPINQNNNIQSINPNNNKQQTEKVEEIKESIENKSAKELDEEIKNFELDIERIKKENERLRKDSN